MTGFTPPAFTALLPHVEHAFLGEMQDHTSDGQPRASRRYRTYETSPLPPMADTLLFILTDLQQNPLHEVQGQLFGLSQAKAHQWLHRLPTVLNLA